MSTHLEYFHELCMTVTMFTLTKHSTVESCLVYWVRHRKGCGWLPLETASAPTKSVFHTYDHDTMSVLEHISHAAWASPLRTAIAIDAQLPLHRSQQHRVKLARGAPHVHADMLLYFFDVISLLIDI